MKYSLNLDKDNYVLSIAHTMNDSVELNLKDYDLTYLSAYRFIDNKLVLDEVKLKELKGEEEQKTKNEKIAKLKQELSSTDYQIIKCSEYQLQGLKAPYNIAALHVTRQALRDRINELESNI